LALANNTWDAYFFRSHDGQEADLVLEKGREREVLEIKLTSAPAPEDVARLGKVAELLEATRHTFICRIKTSIFGDKVWIVNLQDYLNARRPTS
jgi:hypothetical protein